MPLNTGTLVPVASAFVGQPAPTALHESASTKLPSVNASRSPVVPMACGVALTATRPVARKDTPPSRLIFTTGVAAMFAPAVVQTTTTA